AQPARAIASQFQPSERDRSSNEYREAESKCLMATIRLAPLQGYGYGKRMLHAVPIADISQSYEWWDLMAHNQILWVWMRVGTFGFAAFWLMVAAIIMQACRSTAELGSSGQTPILPLFVLLVFSMLLIFAQLDLALCNYRSMLFAGVWAGVLAGAAFRRDPVPNRDVSRAPHAVRAGGLPASPTLSR